MFLLLTVIAWAAAFVPMPTWLALLISVPIGLFGALLCVFGALSAYWDSHLNSGNSGWTGLTYGVLMVAATCVLIYRRYDEYD